MHFSQKYSIFTRPSATDPLPPLSLHCKDREFPRNFDVVPNLDPKLWKVFLGDNLIYLALNVQRTPVLMITHNRLGIKRM